MSQTTATITDATQGVPTRHCPDCDAVLTHPKLLICHACWPKLPHALRQNFNCAPSMDARREAYREILRHIRETKANPELKLA